MMVRQNKLERSYSSICFAGYSNICKRGAIPWRSYNQVNYLGLCNLKGANALAYFAATYVMTKKLV
jgi:hypothetical protein